MERIVEFFYYSILIEFIIVLLYGKGGYLDAEKFYTILAISYIFHT